MENDDKKHTESGIFSRLLGMFGLTPKEIGWHGQSLPAGMKRAAVPNEYTWDGSKGLGIAMVWVPPGSAILGSDSDSDAEPSHSQKFAKGFWLGKYPVTVGEFKSFVDATGYVTEVERAKEKENGTWRNPVSIYGKSLEQDDRHPVVNVTHNDAMNYCKWVGLGLPTELEWEYAARGTDGRRYPWGNEELANKYCWWFESRRESTCPVGQFPKGASPFGALDLLGNVHEWTATPWYEPRPYQAESRSVAEDLAKSARERHKAERVLRGGAWDASSSAWVGTTVRSSGTVTNSYTNTGFRCVRKGT